MEEEVNERIFLNGAPVVGFGDTQPLVVTSPAPLIGTLVGAISGAALGALIGKGIGAAVGAVAGGIGGVVVGGSIAKAALLTAARPPWHRMQPGDSVVAGQQMAIAISAPDLSPLPSDVVTALNGLLSTQGGLVQSDALYPPGTPLPSDWPSDDNLGSGAYRALIHATVSGASFDPASLWKQLPISATIASWTK